MTACKVCGCTDGNPCVGLDMLPCHWAEAELCSCCTTGEWHGVRHPWAPTPVADAMELHTITQLREAAHNRVRAQILLQVPDALLLVYGSSLVAICVLEGFPEATDFVAIRQAALHATRDAHGLLDGALAALLEGCRRDFSSYAAGQ